VPGAIAAALGFFLPTGAIALAAILGWTRLRRSPWPAAVRDALIPVAIGLTLASFYSMARAGLTDPGTDLVAAGSAVALWRTKLPTPLVLLGAGALGALVLAR
jgi:chromate transporter